MSRHRSLPLPLLSRRRRAPWSVFRGLGARCGIVATEFALMAPVLVLLWTGIVEISKMLLLSNRVTGAAQTLADLISRDDCISDNDINEAFSALSHILEPFEPEKAGYDIASITFNAPEGTILVSWREISGVPAATEDGLKTLAAGLGQIGESVIVAVVVYDYMPLFNTIMSGPFRFNETAIMRPRKKAIIPRGSCT